MSAFQVARLEEIDELNDGRQPWRPIRHHLGITSFGINSWTGHEAGDRIINEHDEADDGNEELYVVLRGRASFEIDGERLDAPAGTLVLVQPEARRTAFAEEPETTLLAIGGTRGKAYVVSGWEVWAPIPPAVRGRRLRRRRRPDERAPGARAALPRAAVQPRVLREPRRPDRGRDRASPPGDRSLGGLPFLREGRLGLRPDPRGAGLQGAGRGLST